MLSQTSIMENKKRAPNFSTSDCMLLCMLMGNKSGVGDLNRHAYLRHRFTPTITSSSKKTQWETIATKFNSQAENQRSMIELQKKWDNLVQRHKALYMDYVHNREKTGGGEMVKAPTHLTEAIMDVVGRHTANIQGLGEPLDTTMMALNAAFPHETQSVTHANTSDFSSTTSVLTEENNNRENLPEEVQTIQRLGVCCACHCHRELEKLKEEKLKLQIKLLKRKLHE